MSDYKILWQSSTAINGLPEYSKAILDHSKNILSPNFTLEIEGVPEGTLDLHYRYFEFLNNNYILDNILKAEKKGFNAVALGCFLDPVLQEAREIVDIPVLGLAECNMHFACMFAKKFSVVTIGKQSISKKMADIVENYKIAPYVVPFQYFDIEINKLVNSFKDPGPVLNEFIQASKKAIDNGAEMILPGCGVLNMIAVQNKLTEIEGTGVPILDISGVLMKMAESVVVLADKSNLKVSRSGYYERPSSEHIENVRKIYLT